jgi:hypothetical protein
VFSGVQLSLQVLGGLEKRGDGRLELRSLGLARFGRRALPRFPRGAALDSNRGPGTYEYSKERQQAAEDYLACCCSQSRLLGAIADLVLTYRRDTSD